MKEFLSIRFFSEIDMKCSFAINIYKSSVVQELAQKSEKFQVHRMFLAQNEKKGLIYFFRNSLFSLLGGPFFLLNMTEGGQKIIEKCFLINTLLSRV